MFLRRLELNIAEQPCLLPDETTTFVQDAVGLYEGKYKIPGLQNGRVYLTTHRICYIDSLEPRTSAVAIELRNVENHEFYPGWLKSSPKVTLHPKAARPSSIQSQSYSTIPSPSLGSHLIAQSSNASSLHPGRSLSLKSNSDFSSPRASNVTWVCTICSFANPVPSNFDPTTANPNMMLPPCLSCGIKPSFPHILKAVLKAAAASAPERRTLQSPAQPPRKTIDHDSEIPSPGNDKTLFSQGYSATASFQCPRCTFENHPSLSTCEMCGLSLSWKQNGAQGPFDEYSKRSESPGPTLNGPNEETSSDTECLKISFRAGGEKDFYAKLKTVLVQRKWLLQNAPPVPDPNGQTGMNQGSGIKQPSEVRARPPGIAGLEQQGLERRKRNEAVIGSAFEDLDALMASAKEIVALAESFAKKSGDSSADPSQIIADSAKALSTVTTKDMLGSSAGSESLYLSELSRNLAEYLTDDAKGILRKEGGIISLVDLWAVFNQARGGAELISPLEFEKAARLWEKLRLPVRLRQFKNGLLVVQQADRTDDKTIAQVLTWLRELHWQPISTSLAWDVETFGKGITAQEAAQYFGWSVGVANEELEMAEEKGALCREEGVEGLRFWENWISNDYEDEVDDGINVDPLYEFDPVRQNLEDMGLF